MAQDIKRLLDEIIDNDDSNTGLNTAPSQAPLNHDMEPVKFDKGEFREKLSLNVLKDVISAMMHDDTSDVTGLIDASIMDHINKDYKGTCFGYLCRSRDKLQSPILGDIVQELENTADEAEEEVKTTGVINNNVENPDIATKEILDSVNNYDELRKKLKEEVSKKVVNDVTKVITKSNDAPVFDNIDITLKKSDSQTPDQAAPNAPTEPASGNTENVQAAPGAEPMAQASPQPAVAPPPPADEVKSESVIFSVCSSIVTEAALHGERMSSEEGLNRAIITYCIGEMDALFGIDKSREVVRKYLR